MINPDWKIFETKFSENPQKNFEWFCYLLFCKEFDKAYGIPRIYNQPGIETFPIQQGGEVIGWQAKYYSGKITDHKDDIIDSVEKSKKNYPNLTKFILFCNLEWTATKNGEYPKAKSEILEKCNELNITLEERLLSYFEKIVENKEYDNITTFFFSNIHESRLEIQKTVMTCSIIELPFFKEDFEKRIDVNGNLVHSVNPLIDYFEQLFSTTEFENVTNFYIKGIAGIGKSVELIKTYNHFVSKFSDISNYKNCKFVFVPYFCDLKDFQDDFCLPENKCAPYIMFLDGLDELSDGKTLLLSKALKRLKTSYANIRFVIAGRDAAFVSGFLENESVTELFLNYFIDDSLASLTRQYRGTFFETLIQIPFYREFVCSVDSKNICTYEQFFEISVNNRLFKDKHNNDLSENISERDIDKSKINLDDIKDGLSKLALYLYTQDKRRFSESELRDYLSGDNYIFALKSALFEYKSNEEIYFISNIFLEYFYARSLENESYRKIKKEFLTSTGAIKISKINILYILLNIISNTGKLYSKITNELQHFTQAYILLTDFISLPSETRFASYLKIINEFNSKKELIYYGRFHESNDIFSTIPSLADKMFELLSENKQLESIKFHIQVVESFLKSPNENDLNTFCNSVILLGFGEEKRWNEKCQKLLKQISIPILKFFIRHELAEKVKGLLSSLVVFFWYKTYGWTKDWTVQDWKIFISEMELSTSEDFYSFLDENDYKLKRTLFIHFNDNPDIWKLLISLTVNACLSDDIPGYAACVPSVLDDDFKTPVLHFDNDIFYFRNVIKSEALRITIQDIIEIANQISEKRTKEHTRDYETKEFMEDLSKQYFEKISQITNEDVPILYSIIKNVLKDNNGLYAHDLIRYIQPLSDEIKLAIYSCILKGIENKEISSKNFSLWQPMVYLLKVRDEREAAINYLQKTKCVSISLYKDIFFFCIRDNDEHPCKKYCNEKYGFEFPDDYAKEIAYNKRKDAYFSKIAEMRKREVEFILSPQKIISEIDRILNYLDSEQNPFNKDSERLDLIYLEPEHTLNRYEFGGMKESEEPEVFSEFVIKILRDASFNDSKEVNREKIKADILTWGNLEQNFWRFFFWVYVRKYDSDEVKEFLSEHPEIVIKIKQSMELEFPNILNSQDITVFDGGKNKRIIVPFVYYLESLCENKLLDFINHQEMLKFVAFPAWCLSEYGVHTTGEYKWGEYESVFDWISILINMDKRNIIDYTISVYSKLESDISRTQIISYFCDSVINGTLQSEKVLFLIIQESIQECTYEYNPSDNLKSINYILQNFWNKYESDVVRKIEEYIDFTEYKQDEKNYCRKAMADYIIRHSDSSKKRKIISIIKKKERSDNLVDDRIYLLARLGDEKSTIDLIKQYLEGKKLNTSLYIAGPLFGIENASNKAFRKMIELFEYTLEKSSDRRNELHSIAVGMINRNVTKKNFKILEKHLSVIVSRKRENNEYFEYVQNYLNEVEQKIYS